MSYLCQKIRLREKKVNARPREVLEQVTDQMEVQPSGVVDDDNAAVAMDVMNRPLPGGANGAVVMDEMNKPPEMGGASNGSVVMDEMNKSPERGGEFKGESG